MLRCALLKALWLQFGQLDLTADSSSFLILSFVTCKWGQPPPCWPIVKLHMTIPGTTAIKDVVLEA